MTPGTKLHKRLLFAGWLLGIGLAIEAASLFWAHPTAFVLFLIGGTSLVVLGILTYVWAIVSQ